MNMKNKKFTIITVCYNAEKHIEETIRSLLSQTCNDYEYIIKDGLSTDNTLKIAQSLLEGKENVQIYSGTDKGIYDAMNQALEFAKGEYIFFLNAGDCFANEEVLAKVREAASNTQKDILYGNIIQVNGEQRNIYRYGKICKSKLYYSIGACVCHQAMFAKRELFHDKKFDTTYKVCADREWQLYQMEKEAKSETLNFEIASVLVEGFSSAHVKDLEEEIVRCLDKYCKKTAWIYKLILKIKKNHIVLFVLRALEKIILTKKEK